MSSALKSALGFIVVSSFAVSAWSLDSDSLVQTKSESVHVAKFAAKKGKKKRKKKKSSVLTLSQSQIEVSAA